MIVQYSVSRGTQITGTSRTDDNLCKRLPVKRVVVPKRNINHGSALLFASELYVKYMVNRGQVNHFTDPLMTGIGHASPKNSILTMFDAILLDFYGDRIGTHGRWWLDGLNGFDHIITSSETSKCEISKGFKYPKDNITVILGAVDTKFGKGLDRGSCKDVVRKMYGIPNNATILLYTGNTSSLKNIQYLVWLLQYMNVNYSPTYLIRAGYTDPLEPDMERNRIDCLRLARVLDVHDKYIDVGYVAGMEILYTGVDAYVSASLAEGFGLPPLEAMACGTPVVVSDIPCHREILGPAAYLVPWDLKRWMDAIIIATSNSQFRLDMMEKRVGMYSWDKSSQILNEVYEAML